MLQAYLNTKDEKESRSHQNRKVGAGWWYCCLASCFTIGGLITIASVIAISLIPAYLSKPLPGGLDDAVENTNLSLLFSTDYQLPSNTSSSFGKITSIQQLSSQISAALHIPRDTISVKLANFMSQTTEKLFIRRRRQAICEVGGDPLSNVFIEMILEAIYPHSCGHNTACKAKFLSKLMQLLEEMPTLMVTIAFDNGLITVTISIKICRITPEPSGTTTTTTTTTTTISATTTSTIACHDTGNYTEPNTGHTCQTYSDYGFCNGTAVVASDEINADLAQNNCCLCGKGKTQSNG